MYTCVGACVLGVQYRRLVWECIYITPVTVFLSPIRINLHLLSEAITTLYWFNKPPTGDHGYQLHTHYMTHNYWRSHKCMMNLLI